MRGRFFLVGGAGFIGSHIAERLLRDPEIEAVTVYDNFSSGRRWHLAHLTDTRLRVVTGDVKDLDDLRRAMAGHDVVVHLASNPDIARAQTEPDIDFREGTFLTQQVVEAMRLEGARRILYASGSGIYGERGLTECHEDMGPLVPVSTYGASKLAGEALIASYAFMFGMSGVVLRFGNVVGPRQTHGVGYDFVRRLLDDPRRLRILGNGTQSKSYVHIEDIVDAIFLVHQKSDRPWEAFNVATGDYITVREIADLAVQVVDLAPGSVTYEMTGGDRGWTGDVPVIRLATEKIRALGWRNRYGCAEAMRRSMASLLVDARAGERA